MMKTVIFVFQDFLMNKMTFYDIINYFTVTFDQFRILHLWKDECVFKMGHLCGAF